MPEKGSLYKAKQALKHFKDVVRAQRELTRVDYTIHEDGMTRTINDLSRAFETKDVLIAGEMRRILSDQSKFSTGDLTSIQHKYVKAAIDNLAVAERDAGFLGKSNRGLRGIHKTLSRLADFEEGASDFVTQYRSHIGDYGKRIAQVVLDLNDLSANSRFKMGFSVNDDAWESHVRQLEDVFNMYKDSVDLHQKRGAMGSRKITKQERNTFTNIELMLKKRLDSLERSVEISKDLSSLDGEFEDRMRIHSNLYAHHREFVYKEFVQMQDNILAKNFIGFARNVLDVVKYRKALYEKRKLMPRRGKAQRTVLGKMSGTIPKLLLAVQVVSKLGSKLVGALLGINDLASKFNNEMVKGRGLMSLGVRMDNIGVYNLTETLNKYRSMFYKFGFDTKTFLAPEEVNALTLIFDKYGIKLSELTEDGHSMGEMFNIAFNIYSRTGIKPEQTLDAVAKWRREFGMSVSNIAGLMGHFSGVVAATGLDGQFFLDTISGADVNYGIWGNSLVNLLTIQADLFNKQQKGKIAAKNTFNRLISQVSGMKAVDWSVVATRMPDGILKDIVYRDVESARKILSDDSNDDPQIRAQAQYFLKVWDNVTKENTAPNYATFLARYGSLESQITALAEYIRTALGPDAFEELSKDIRRWNIEEQLKVLLGFQGNLAEFEETVEFVKEILDPSFDVHSLKTSADELTSSEQIDKMTSLQDMERYVFTHEKKFGEMMWSGVNKYIVDAINMLEKILGLLRRIYARSKDDKRSLESILANAMNLVSRLNAEDDPERQEEILQELITETVGYVRAGGDAEDIIRKIDPSHGERVRSAIEGVSAEDDYSYDGVFGGELSKLSDKWKTLIRSKFRGTGKHNNPQMGEKVIQALEKWSARTGIPANVKAAQAMTESDFDPDTARSWVGAGGITQFMPATAQEMGVTLAQLEADPALAIEMSYKYDLKIKRFLDSTIPDYKKLSDADQRKVIEVGYNAGMGNMRDFFNAAKRSLGTVRKFEDIIPYMNSSEAREYAGKISGHLRTYGGQRRRFSARTDNNAAPSAPSTPTAAKQRDKDPTKNQSSNSVKKQQFDQSLNQVNQVLKEAEKLAQK